MRSPLHVISRSLIACCLICFIAPNGRFPRSLLIGLARNWTLCLSVRPCLTSFFQCFQCLSLLKLAVNLLMREETLDSRAARHTIFERTGPGDPTG